MDCCLLVKNLLGRFLAAWQRGGCKLWSFVIVNSFMKTSKFLLKNWCPESCWEADFLRFSIRIPPGIGSRMSAVWHHVCLAWIFRMRGVDKITFYIVNVFFLIVVLLLDHFLQTLVATTPHFLSPCWKIFNPFVLFEKSTTFVPLLGSLPQLHELRMLKPFLFLFTFWDERTPWKQKKLSWEKVKLLAPMLHMPSASKQVHW